MIGAVIDIVLDRCTGSSFAEDGRLLDFSAHRLARKMYSTVDSKITCHSFCKGFQER